MSRKKQIGLIIVSFILVIYFFFFPSPTPELAIRKHMMLSFHPIKAFKADVHNPKIADSYGLMYVVDSMETPFFHVKRNVFGWRVTSVGTGP